MCDPVFGFDAKSDNLRERLETAALSDLPILFLGESGTQKSRAARWIHRRSARSLFSFLNCSGPQITENDLFGTKTGESEWLQQVWGGSLWLREVDFLSEELQKRLESMLYDSSTNIRFFFSLKRDRLGLAPIPFGLFAALDAYPIRLPSLREYPELLPEFIERILWNRSESLGAPFILPSEEEMKRLVQYKWPGNVKQLKHVLYKAIRQGQGVRLDIETTLSFESGDSSPVVLHEKQPLEFKSSPQENDSFVTMDEAIKEHIKKALQKTGGRIEGPQGAAHLLDMNPSTLRTRIRKYFQ